MDTRPPDTLTLLLSRLFDYAGMFPPAGRTFEEALRECGSFPTSLQRPWMLGSDIVLDAEHATKLLTVDLPSYGIKRNISICFLATDSPATCIDILTKIRGQRRKDGVTVAVSSIEAKASLEGIQTLIEHLLPFAKKNSILLAIEPDLSAPSWDTSLETTVNAIRGQGIALKCRCTGPTGIGPERLARAIVLACDNGLPLKVTGGLHHPIVEPGRYDNRIGFLNLATAVALRRSCGAILSEEKISTLLGNTDFTAITFGETLSYEGVSSTYDQVAQALSSAAFAIGSCSLHEPDADLSRLSQRDQYAG